MNQNSDGGPEVHHNVFTGPTVIGGTQNLAGVTPAPASPQPSIPSRIWIAVTMVWALSPGAAWWAQTAPGGPLFSKLADLAHATTPYILLVGGAAVCLDVAGYFLHSRWAVAQRAITDPVTWKLRLVAAAVGVVFVFAVFMSGR